MTGGSVRACQACRVAKTKCDFARPTCGRCQRLHVRCTGYTAEVDFIFRSENVTAARNSKRARLAVRKRSAPSSTRSVSDGKQSSASVSSISGDTPNNHHSSDEEELWPDFDIADETPVPASVSTPVIDRAVHRYFEDWVITPTRKGRQPGHMIHAIALYLSADSTSTYRTAIQACAYAHLQFENDGAFANKARSTYGKALMCMKDEIADKYKVHDDRLLAAVLLLDGFETLHLNRRDALGPHSKGVKHILAARGRKQFTGGQSFALWRIAHHRLLARQIYDRQSPDPAQIHWMRMVEVDRPDLRLSVDALEMCILIGRATALLHEEPDLEPEERRHAAQRLVFEMKDLINTMHLWLASLPEAWKPTHVNGMLTSEPIAFHTETSYGPMPRRLAIHHDMWLAYMLEYREVTELVMRESMIELFEMIEALSDSPDPQFFQDCIEQEVAEIKHITDAIIAQIPKFKYLAFNSKGPLQRSFERPELAGRFHSVFAMSIMDKAAHVPAEAKLVARWVFESVKVDYQLH